MIKTAKQAAALAQAELIERTGREAFAQLREEMRRNRDLGISANLWPPSPKTDEQFDYEQERDHGWSVK